MTVIKRDGQVEDLEPKKILNSIIKANDNVKSDEKLTPKQLTIRLITLRRRPMPQQKQSRRKSPMPNLAVFRFIQS